MLQEVVELTRTLELKAISKMLVATMQILGNLSDVLSVRLPEIFASGLCKVEVPRIEEEQRAGGKRSGKRLAELRAALEWAAALEKERELSVKDDVRAALRTVWEAAHVAGAAGCPWAAL